jgi:hypothetical protein
MNPAANDVTLRFMYGDYKFADGNSGRIRFGQIPGIAFTSSYHDVKFSADNGMIGYGNIMEARRVGINYEIGGFSVSAISMRQDAGAVQTALTTGTGLSNPHFREIMPRLEVAYSVSAFKIAGSYVKSSIVADTETSVDKLYHLDAGHIMVAANPKIANNTQLIMSGFYSVNAGLYQMAAIGGGFNDNEAVSRSVWALPSLKEADKTDLNNTSVVGGAVALLVNAFEIGVGIQSANNDAWEDSQNGMGIYANYKYRISNFRITPEFRYLHSGDLRGSQVKDTRGLQIGVQFRFDL